MGRSKGVKAKQTKASAVSKVAGLRKSKTKTVNVNLKKVSIDFNYKEGNNRPSSVNQKSLFHKHNKPGNKCHTQDNTNTWENQSIL